MKPFRSPRSIKDYGLFLGALVPTLIILLAAGVSLIDRGAAEGITLPVIPIYRAS